MKIAVRYYSKTGNTKKLAEAIAKVAGVPALPLSAPLTEPVDLLFLGSSVYAAGVAREVRDFIASLDCARVDEVVCFSTAALLPSTYAQVSKLLAERNIPVCTEEFHCRGQFQFLHRGKPDQEDLTRVQAFAATQIFGGQPHEQR